MPRVVVTATAQAEPRDNEPPSECIGFGCGTGMGAAAGYLNAHGTGTMYGHVAETLGIEAAFGEHARGLRVSSTKSMHRHSTGATGALELTVAIQAVRQRALPPTAHLDVRDPVCDLDYIPSVTRHEVDVSVALSSSFAFGGASTVLVARQHQ